jgi:hypothetical protein
MPATEVRIGDVVRTGAGTVVTVSRIETPFLGRADMLAFIEDTEKRWYKQPVRREAEVEVLVRESP